MIDSMTHVQRMLKSFSNLQNPSLAKEMANTSVCLENEDGIRANGRFSELPQDILPHDAAQLILETLRALEHSALSDIDTEMVNRAFHSAISKWPEELQSPQAGEVAIAHIAIIGAYIGVIGDNRE